MRFNCEKKETIYQGGEGQRLREARALLPEDSEPILRKRKQVARSQGHVHERGLVSERHLGNNTQMVETDEHTFKGNSPVTMTQQS